MNETKRCPTCKSRLVIDEFYGNKATKDGLSRECKDCTKKRNSEYRKKHQIRDSNKSHRPYNENRYRKWAYATIHGHELRGHTINATIDELEEMAKATPTCPLCGSEIVWDNKGMAKASSPSWDRKYNGERMTSKNTWVICKRCNSMKNDMPLPELVEWCRVIVEKFS
jgi:hypothetical protein